MAYNSDGYIMIDFAEVDFSKTNQTIDGLFDRCQKVIGTNKFVIVINANNKTPLPSTVCITNGQYVIESVLFTFSISSSDNLHITKKTNVDELIDDNHVTLKTTYSSSKIESLYEDGKLKTFDYIGNGETSNRINIPINCKYIISIVPNSVTGTGSYNFITCYVGFPILENGSSIVTQIAMLRKSGNATNTSNLQLSFGDSYVDLTSTATTLTPDLVLNSTDVKYTVYYL